MAPRNSSVGGRDAVLRYGYAFFIRFLCLMLGGNNEAAIVPFTFLSDMFCLHRKLVSELSFNDYDDIYNIFRPMVTIRSGFSRPLKVI